MDGFGDDFFSGAAFAGDQHSGAGRRDLGDQVEDDLHFVALANYVREIVALLQGALELHVLIAQAAAFDRERNLRDQFVVGPRLGDEVLRAALESRTSHVNRAERGDQDDGELRITAADFTQQFQTVAIGQADVQQHEIEGLIFELLQASLAGFSESDLKTFGSEKSLEPFPDFNFIINNENRTSRHGQLS